MKSNCQRHFSEKIRTLMTKMKGEKTRPQIIAISAKQTIREHPECAPYLERPKKEKEERVMLSPRYYILMSSKSFRLYHDRPSVIRVFFLRREPEDKRWKKALRDFIIERFRVAIPLRDPTIQNGDNFVEIDISSCPDLLFQIMRSRVATFLDP